MFRELREVSCSPSAVIVLSWASLASSTDLPPALPISTFHQTFLSDLSFFSMRSSGICRMTGHDSAAKCGRHAAPRCTLPLSRPSVRGPPPAQQHSWCTSLLVFVGGASPVAKMEFMISRKFSLITSWSVKMKVTSWKFMKPGYQVLTWQVWEKGFKSIKWLNRPNPIKTY